MNFELDDDQLLLQSACKSIFERHAGPDRARALAESGAVDRALVEVLHGAGMLDIAADPQGGPLAAQLVVEWAAEAGAFAPIGWRMLVAPHVLSGDPPDVIAVVSGLDGGLTRFGADADLVLAIEGGQAVAAAAGQWRAIPVQTKYGFPLTELEILGGTALDESAADSIVRWGQVVLASEIAGAARSALSLTVQYVKDRHQFGRSLGSYQAIQHKLAEDHMTVEALSLLAKEAAFLGAPAEAAAVTATFGAGCAHRIMTDLHQFTGAIGFAKEYDLYLWSMRLKYLALEAGGLNDHADRLFTSRWAVSQ